MTIKRAVQGPLSVEEFLAFDNNSLERHEFVAGRVFAMVGTTARHNKIIHNVVRKLHDAAHGGSCHVYFTDLKVRAANDRIYYPDVTVVCTPHDDETVMFDSACLVVEVTSRGTRRIDRGEKLDAYLAMSSLRGYLIVEHDRRHVSLYWREIGGEWAREEVVGSGEVALPCPATTLSLDHIYEGIEPESLRVREDADVEDYEWVDVTPELT
jgi:Uma2 family endonuclease